MESRAELIAESVFSITDSSLSYIYCLAMWNSSIPDGAPWYTHWTTDFKEGPGHKMFTVKFFTKQTTLNLSGTEPVFLMSRELQYNPWGYLF